MAQYNYSFNETKENMAKAVGRNLNISPKQSIEICNYLRGRKLSQAKNLLQMAIDKKKPIPFKRFTNGLGHKPGIEAGRYCIKASTEIMKVLNQAESNAKNQGLNASDLKLLHISTQTAPKQWHYGRKKRSVFKAAHIEVVVQEVKGLGSKAKSDKPKNEKKDKSAK